MGLHHHKKKNQLKTRVTEMIHYECTKLLEEMKGVLALFSLIKADGIYYL